MMAGLILLLAVFIATGTAAPFVDGETGWDVLLNAAAADVAAGDYASASVSGWLIA